MKRTMKRISVGLAGLLIACATASAGLIDFETMTGPSNYGAVPTTYQPIAGVTITYDTVGVYNNGPDHTDPGVWSTFESADVNSVQKFIFDTGVEMPSVWLETFYGGTGGRSMDVTVRAFSDEAGSSLLRESVITTPVAHGTGTGYVWSEFTGFSDLTAIRRLEFTSGGNAQVDDMTINVIPEPATIGMLGLAGAGLLFVRRRFMI